MFLYYFMVRVRKDKYLLLWTGFWIRNSSLPVSKVEVINENHSNWFKLEREQDGSFAMEILLTI